MLKIFFAFVIALLTSSISYGQTNELYVHFANELCSSSIKLNTDGSFNYGSGCERSSYISFGTWIKKGDTIKFKQVDLTDFKILKIISLKKENENSLNVKVFNQFGENITEKIKLGQFVKGKGIYDMTLDSSKTIRTDLRRDSGIIIFKNFEKLLNKNSDIKVNNHNHFEIILNIPYDWIYQINSNWINIGDFELIKTKDSLTSITSDSFDEKGNAIKTVYHKY